MDSAMIHRLFTFDFATGSVFWKSPPYNHPRLLNKEAGGPRPNHSKEYWVIKIGRKAVKRGRLIFFAAHGRWPTPCVDHIDGNSLNDALTNLREATVTENAWNHKKRAKRSHLPMGVRLIPVSGRYQARIAHNRRMFHLGSFDTPTEAHSVYLTKRKELYGEYA